MNARELMAAADKLTGAHTGMNAEEIRAAQDVTLDTLTVRYFVEKYKEIDDYKEKYEIAERLRGALARSPGLQSYVSKELPKLILRPPKKGQRKSKPRSTGEVRFE